MIVFYKLLFMCIKGRGGNCVIKIEKVCISKGLCSGYCYLFGIILFSGFWIVCFVWF